MMFFEQAFEGKNEISRWIAMILLVVLFTQIVGAIPVVVIIAIAMATNPDIEPNLENPMDLSVYGISQIEALALIIIPFAMGAVALYLFHHPIHKRCLLTMLTASPRFRWKRFFWGGGIWLVMMVVTSVLSVVAGYQDVELHFNPTVLVGLLLVSLLLLPLQTGFEEFFFRGYLMQGIGILARNRWAPLLITSLIFGLMHYFNPEVSEYGAAVMLPQYIWFGLFFGICTLMDEGIELAWGAHAVNNIFLSVFFTQDSSALQTPALFTISETNPLVDFAGLVVMSILFIGLAARHFDWPGWRFLFSRITPPPTDEEGLTGFEEEEDYQFDNQIEKYS